MMVNVILFSLKLLDVYESALLAAQYPVLATAHDSSDITAQPIGKQGDSSDSSNLRYCTTTMQSVLNCSDSFYLSLLLPQNNII